MRLVRLFIFFLVAGLQLSLFAQEPGPPVPSVKVITACVSKFDGYVRIVPLPKDCVRSFETMEQWGHTGPQGPQGLAGVPGLPGVTGATGLPGVAGLSGGAGVAGPIGPAGLVGPAGPSGPAGAAGAVGTAGSSGGQVWTSNSIIPGPQTNGFVAVYPWFAVSGSNTPSFSALGVFMQVPSACAASNLQFTVLGSRGTKPLTATLVTTTANDIANSRFTYTALSCTAPASGVPSISCTNKSDTVALAPGMLVGAQVGYFDASNIQIFEGMPALISFTCI